VVIYFTINIIYKKIKSITIKYEKNNQFEKLTYSNKIYFKYLVTETITNIMFGCEERNKENENLRRINI